MKLLSRIKNLFHKEPKQEQPDTSVPDDCSYILFLINKDNDPYVKVVIGDTSPEAAKSMSDLIHNLCTGNYTESILKVLLDMRHQDRAIYNCVHNIILQIMKRGNTSLETSDSPQVKPTQFFNNKHD